MTSVKRINHIAIVVDEIEDALHFWRDALGLKVARVEEVPDQDSIVAFLPVGDMEIELVKPTSDEGGIARYLKKRGPGVHHICFEVDDIETSLESLKANGVRLINSEPAISTSGKRFAFIHPESTHGVLIELYELPHK
jgi:methylmalonyl-CoA/ethylmalonyl-CoA epimerase